MLVSGLKSTTSYELNRNFEDHSVMILSSNCDNQFTLQALANR